MDSCDEISTWDFDFHNFTERFTPPPNIGSDDQCFNEYQYQSDSAPSFRTNPAYASEQSVDCKGYQEPAYSSMATQESQTESVMPQGFDNLAMHTGQTSPALLDKRRRCPAQESFVEKLYKIGTCDAHAAVLGFSDDGSYIELRSATGLTQVLKLYFKHSNTSSFIRQLNNYGFRTMYSMAKEKNIQCFIHPDFKRDAPESVEKITRKSAVNKKHKRITIKDLQRGKDVNSTRIRELEELNQSLERKVRRLEHERFVVHTSDCAETVNQGQWEDTSSLQEQYQQKQMNAMQQVPHLTSVFVPSTIFSPGPEPTIGGDDEI